MAIGGGFLRDKKSKAPARNSMYGVNLLIALCVFSGICEPCCFAFADKINPGRNVVSSTGLESPEDLMNVPSNRKLFNLEDNSHAHQQKKQSPMLLPLLYRSVNLSLGNSNDYIPRSMLGNARAELLGHVRRGYYFTRLFLGTPPKKFELIVDTGSTVTYVPCSNCEHCGKHADKSFVPANSSTYEILHCSDNRCRSGLCERRKEQCMYDRHYAEESSSTGLLALDNLSFGEHSSIGTPRIIFGCETDEEGALFQQNADGIIGLGRGPFAVPNQLADGGIIDDSFSLCYGGMDDEYEHAGAIIMGAIDPPAGMVWATTDPSHMHSQYYNLKVEGIQVQGVKLDIDPMVFESGYGSLLDSGTTFTYLPTAAFDAFHAAVVNSLKEGIMRIPGPDKNYNDICFGGATSENLEDDFPQVDLVFYPNAVVSLAPENYLFKHRKRKDGYCFGFFDNGDEAMGTLLGGVLTRNMLVDYDRQNNRIGFFKTQCNQLMTSFPFIPQSQLTASSPASPHTPPPLSSPPPLSQSPPLNAPPPPVIASSPPPLKPPPSTPPLPPPFSPPFNPPPAPPPMNSTCQGCVEQIVVDLNLNIPKDSFVPLIPAFINELASKINVNPSQIEVSSYEKGEESNAVILKFIVHPTSSHNNGSFPYFSETAAQEIAVRLQDHKIKLREIFGAYKVISVDLEPAREHDQESSSQKMRLRLLGAMGGMMGVAVLAGVLALVIVWRRRNAASKYESIGQELEDETGALL